MVVEDLCSGYNCPLGRGGRGGRGVHCWLYSHPKIYGKIDKSTLPLPIAACECSVFLEFGVNMQKMEF